MSINIHLITLCLKNNNLYYCWLSASFSTPYTVTTKNIHNLTLFTSLITMQAWIYGLTQQVYVASEATFNSIGSEPAVCEHTEKEEVFAVL